jgi:Repeat of unknown function (DUF5650)/Carboxypeptidase regulatory-like domain
MGRYLSARGNHRFYPGKAIVMLKNTLPVFIFLFLFVVASNSQNIDIHGPEGSARFGDRVLILPNGNIAVADPEFDAGKDLPDVGAVYLYNGTTAQLLTSMIGNSPGDRIGSGGLVHVSANDFLVLSPEWDGAAPDAGAITRCGSFSGCPAKATVENSLTGSSTGDQPGDGGVYILANGNYVIASRSWDNGGIENAGAATFCNKSAGPPLSITPENSLVGSHIGDMTFETGIFPLANGNYVVRTSFWDNGTAADAGAVTLGSGETGVSGEISAENSLVGTHQNDQIGVGGVYPLPNGNYVVASHSFHNGFLTNAGAVTFCSGAVALTGPVESFNSLMGLTEGDSVGSGGVTVLDNGNYVVGSPLWHNGDQTSAGAATWGNMNTGITGVISESNSIVGAAAFNQVGGKTVALTNGNYVIVSQYSAIGSETMRGAVTLGNGNTGSAGIVSKANSLIGKTNDRIGEGGVFPLTNGNYVVASPMWRNGKMLNAGAVTFGNGSGGVPGAVTASNSLVGTAADDKVGDYGVIALWNGNFIVRSTFWNNAGIEAAGAVTWGNGFTGISGAISAANSLVGTNQGDRIGLTAVPLNNGNYVAGSPVWNGGTGAATWGNGDSGIAGPVTPGNSLTGAAPGQLVGAGCGTTPLVNGNYVVCTLGYNGEAGAVTWADGRSGITGAVSQANSLTGASGDDRIASYMVIPLLNGNYVVRSPEFGAADSGAITRGNGSVGTRGPVSAATSVLGLAANGGVEMQFYNDPGNYQIVVSRPADNVVTLYRTASAGSVTGRVATADGQPIRNASVSLTDINGRRTTALSSPLGFYAFQEIAGGRSYTVSVSAKRFRFGAPRTVFVDGDITGYDFVSQPEF